MADSAMSPAPTPAEQDGTATLQPEPADAVEAALGEPRASRAIAPPPSEPPERALRAAWLLHSSSASLRRSYVEGLQRTHGNAFVARALHRTTGASPGLGAVGAVIGRQEQEEEEVAAVDPPKEKRYNLSLSSGSFQELTEEEALAKLWESYNTLSQQVESLAGQHATLQRSRNENLFVGLGGIISDTFIGRDIPPLSMWEKPRNLLTAAKLALSSRAVEEAANTLKMAGEAYSDARDLYRTYTDELEMAGGATQVAIAAIPVAVLVIGLTVIAVAPAAGGAAAGGAAEAGATAGAAEAAGATEAAAATGAGGAVVGGGAGGATATATTIASGETVAGIAARAAALMASGDLQGLTAFLTGMAATPSGRQAILNAAQTVVAAMQSPGLVQREFQFLKQLSELLFQFARGGA